MTTKAEIDAMKFALAQRANKGVAHMEGGGQARTRAGTIAQPTFIDEQLAKTSERLSKLYNDPNQAMKDIARQYFPSSTDTPAQQQQKLEDLALGFAGSIKTPKAPKSPLSTGGDYLPGVHYADPLQAPTMRMSEALGNVGAEGKTLRFTEADRSRVFGPNRGGVGFSALQHYSIPHKEARTVWGYGNESKARQKINQGSPESTLWTTYAGSPTQHKSNTVVVKDAIKTLQEANKAGTVHPEQINLINYRLQQAVGDNGKPLFPEGFDITDPKALSHATTFDRRAIISDVLMGLGVKKPMRSVEFKEANPGVVWSDASNIENILTRETEPILKNANTFDVGPNLFTIENQVIHRPDLNEAFPYQVTGEDLGMRFEPTPFREAAPEFTKDIPIDEAINAWKMSRGNPSQFVSEEYLTNLQKMGRKDGGAVHMEKGGFLDNLKEQLGLEYESLKKPGAVTDIINRGVVAPIMGAATDIPNMALEGADWLQSKIPGLRKTASVMDTQNPIPQRQDPAMGYVPKFPLATDEPYGGTAHAQRLMREADMTSSTERPLMEAVAGIAAPFSPAAALKAVKAGKAMAPRAGALLERAAAKGQPMPLEMGVVKTKGGNWLAGESERLTNPFLQKATINNVQIPYGPELEAAALQRAEDLRRQANAPGYTGGALRAAEHIEQQLEIPRTNEIALNKWIDKKLNSYIKNEMGTPEDSIRLGIERRAAEAEKLKEANQVRLDKMAADIERNKAAGKDTTLTERDLEAAKDKFDEEYEIASQGLYHGTVPEGGWMGGNVWEPLSLLPKREKEGFPKGGMSTHPAAKQWEIVSDLEIQSTPARQFVGDGMPESYYDRTNSLAKDYNQKVLDQNPWLSKVDPETKVYKLDEMNPDVGLEFRHMIDEVKTAMDPASNLPKHLKIAPKDLEKMTVDDVSALSGKISAWRNARKNRPNLELANNPAVSTFKEYPTANNPKGVSWRQIKRPEGLPDEEADEALREAIGYEGDIMRHCVGGSGHCEPLLKGETEVYSLRDAKGEPHVTIEVEQGKPWNERSGVFYDNPELESSWQQFSKEQSLEAKTQGSSRPRDYIIDYPAWLKNNEPELYNKYQDLFKPDASAIVEIKGKNNRPPKPEYLPFVQDFVKSGNWSRVGDIHHTDLRDSKDVFNQLERKTLQDSGYQIDRYLSSDEIKNLQNVFKQIEAERDIARKKQMSTPFTDEQITGNWEPEGMRRGGAVRMAAGGAAFNTDPDMSDGGQIRPAMQSFEGGGRVHGRNEYAPSLPEGQQYDIEASFADKMGAAASDAITGNLIKAYNLIADKQKLPASHRIYLDTFAEGNRSPITEKQFNPDELEALQNLIAYKSGANIPANPSGKFIPPQQKGSVNYSDYMNSLAGSYVPPAGKQLSSPDILEDKNYPPKLKEFLESNSALKTIRGDVSPLYSVRQSLGKFNYELNPETLNYDVAREKYDFNPMKATSYKGRTVDPTALDSDYVGGNIFSPVRIARVYGGRKMPPGTGRDVQLSVPYVEAQQKKSSDGLSIDDMKFELEKRKKSDSGAKTHSPKKK